MRLCSIASPRVNLFAINSERFAINNHVILMCLWYNAWWLVNVSAIKSSDTVLMRCGAVRYDVIGFRLYLVYKCRQIIEFLLKYAIWWRWYDNDTLAMVMAWCFSRLRECHVEYSCCLLNNYHLWKQVFITELLA